MAVGARLPVAADTAWLAARVGDWKTVSLRARCLLFVLSGIAAGSFAAIFELLHFPAHWLAAGTVLIVLAEWLAVGRRFFAAGIEEALEAGGSLLIVVGIADMSSNVHGTGIALLVAAALMVCGVRLLNPLLTTLAVLALAFAVNAASPRTAADVLAGVFCVAAAALALGLGATQLRRPAHEQMLNYLVIAMPLAGFVWVQDGYGAGPIASLRPIALGQLLAVLMPLVYGAVALVVGVRRRRHAPLIAFMVCVGCLAYELRNITGLALEVRLIVWGCALLALAGALDRYLRMPRAGVTSMKLGEAEESWALELIGPAALAPPMSGAAGPPFKGGGGTGGGGGASGTY
jgi:hypothetical protein